jgi:hypothetical protein
MNWDAIGAFSELLAATGGIVAIVYLALQLRQNTHALDRSERAASTRAVSCLIFPSPIWCGTTARAFLRVNWVHSWP